VTHYEVLGVAPAAPLAEVRRAYVALARVHHPDRVGGDAARMQAINAAWATLSDPARRARYDATLAGFAGDAFPGAGAADGAGTYATASSLEDDLEDDTPIGGQVVLPRWVSLVPVGTFAASIVVFVGSLLMAAPVGIGLSVGLFLLSCTLFLAAPFVALLASRRGGR
jgi:curved DNA-binding protein CbpA